MMQPIKSMNELVRYLGRQEEHMVYLEQRIKALEEENQRLRTAPPGFGPAAVDRETIARYVAVCLPQTNIVHPSFVKRALAVYGHYFAVQMVISTVLFLLYCLFMTALATMIQSSG